MPDRPFAREPPVVSELRAEVDPTLVAVLGQPYPLLYAGGGSSGEDYPGFARAASAIRRWHEKRVVVQDDVNVLALLGAAPGEALEPLLLPRGAAGRRRFEADIGNKRVKLDLEAALVLPDGRFLAFGSGSLPARERIVVIAPGATPEVRDASELYARLRSHSAFAGSELNLEGALVRGGGIELFQRGNGAVSAELQPVNAVGTLSLDEFLLWLDHAGPAPDLCRVIRVDLGRHAGVAFGFTDATLRANGGIAFLAVAEASPDALLDGPVLGARLGLLDTDGARLVQIVDAHGQACTLKLEGIEAHADDATCFDVVADMDDPHVPSLGALLRLCSR